MSYLSDMISSANSPAAAYLQFLTEKNRESYIAFAFVEDEDDIIFYQHALSNLTNICYFGCGGKDGVIKVFEKLDSEAKADGNLFMVDRDSEVPPFRHAEEILRTSVYSWESHFCAPGIAALCVQRNTLPNLSAAQAAALEDKWLASLDAFKDAFALHSALLTLRSATDVELGLGNIRFSIGAIDEDGVLSPAAELLPLLHGKIDEAGFSEERIAELGALRASFREKPVPSYARGKTLFELIRRFVVAVAASLGSVLREQMNSALKFVALTRWDHPDFDYIRAYAQARIGEVEPAEPVAA